MAEFEQAARLAPGNSVMQAVLGQALALAGWPDAARRILADLGDLAQREFVEASLFAFLWTGLGERERALDGLEEACRQGSRFIPFLATWSVYDPLRDHPRWPALLRSAGLLEGE